MSKRLNDEENTNFILLNYHKVSRNDFIDHMLYLDKKYDIISYEEFIDSFKKKDYPSDLTFVITFDDGSNNFYNEVYPVCNELSIPVIIFITTGPIVHNDPFWWEKVKEKNRLGGKISKKKLLPPTTNDTDNISINEISKYNYTNNNDVSLKKEQLLELNSSNNISFGSHTVTHTNLSKEKDKNVLYELKESKEFLEKLLEKEIIHFAYPNGDYDDKIIPMLSKLGYKSACKVGDRWVSRKDNLFEIPRVGAGSYGCSVQGLKTRIAGTTRFLKGRHLTL